MLNVRPPKQGLSVEFVTVEELYAGPYTFNLPWFQRAYAWTEDLAQRLLSDIHQAYSDGAHRYFIGHVLLAHKSGEQRHALVDGQQRAVTLMILFALLRHRLAGTEAASRIAPLLEAGSGPEGAQYRLSPQPTLEKFFREHVQSPEAMSRPVDEATASEVERNILSNRARLDERLTELRDEGCDLAKLSEFLLTRCLLVLEVIDNEADNEAWRMLQIEENTGLPYHDGARAKVTLIEAMLPDERDEAGRLWEKSQAALGDSGMHQLINHIRDLSGRQRSSQPVEKDIVTRFRLNSHGLEFMHDHLVPSADRLVALRSHKVGHGRKRSEIDRYLRHMEWCGHVFWCPAGMRWLESNGGDHADTVEFFRLLSRKVWLLRITGADSVEHERRFITLCNEIADGCSIPEISELAVSGKLRGKVRENLLSRTFFFKRYSRPVLRYLSELMGADPGTIDGNSVTVEHVLPKSPDRHSKWLREFGSSKGVNSYAHRIGNMALLSFHDNQIVGNSEYIDKREVLKTSKFALSVDAAAADAWTAEHIQARSERLTNALFDHWQLEP
jgi:Protein of unknown function DUF262/Protein of unknown function (DUF1524)